MLCSAAVTAQFIAGKAARDAIYLANLDITTLPFMVMATSAFSIVLVILSSKLLRRISPVTFVPLLFTATAALFLAAWWLLGALPKLGAPFVYLQVSGIGPMLGSGFWLIATERFDPRTRQTPLRPDCRRRHARRPGRRADRRTGRGHRRPSTRCCRCWPRSTCSAPGRSTAWPRPATRPAPPRARVEPSPGALGRSRRFPACVCSRTRRICVTSPAGPARHHQQRSHRLSLQRPERRLLRPRRQPAALLRPLLRRHQPDHLRHPDVEQPHRARTPGTGRYHGDAIHCRAARQHRRLVRPRPGRHDRPARRRIGVPRLRSSAPATSCSTPRCRSAEKRAAKSIIDVGVDRLGDAAGGLAHSPGAAAGTPQPARRAAHPGDRGLVAGPALRPVV